MDKRIENRFTRDYEVLVRLGKCAFVVPITEGLRGVCLSATTRAFGRQWS
jgi:hypothetical protein